MDGYQEGPSAEGPCVLVVEDHAPLRELIETVLCGAGYKVITTASGEEALVIARKTGVDVLITDVGLPGLSGGELVQNFHTCSPTSRSIVISGSDLQTLKRLAPGAHILQKPFTRKSLLAIVLESLSESLR